MEQSQAGINAHNWDFRDALRRKFCSFSGIFYEFVNKNKKRYYFETVKSRDFKLTS